jgi:PAS domain S-box-containing protein
MVAVTTPAQTAGANTRELRKSRILLIDDGPCLPWLQDVLIRAGYRNLDAYSDPVAAIAAYTSAPADLVLLDMRVADMEGESVIGRLMASTPAGDYLALLAIADEDDREMRLHALAAGAGDVVSRPFDSDELLYRVRNLLDTHLLNARLSEQIVLGREKEASLRDSEERFKLATQAADEGLWDWNIRTGSVFMSPRWKALIGYADDELPNTLEAWTSHVHPEDLSQAMVDLEAYMDGKLSSYEKTLRVRHRDGGYRWIQNRWMAVRDESGMAARIVGMADDITGDVELREELEQARRRAESANRAKSEFLANMSHEIRTPLTAIIGFAEAGLDHDQTPTERGESLRAIVDNGRHLRALIDDILDLSKIEAERLEVETVPVDLIDMVFGCHAALRAEADAKGLALEIHLMPPLPRVLNTDPTRFKQILYNLCNNAVKFTERGEVRTVISCDPALQQLTFTVVDQGIGMDATQVAQVFEPFVQGDASTTRRFGGTGLGLSISRRLAKRLGGDIDVISEPGVGSVFVLSIATGPLRREDLVDDPRNLSPPPCKDARRSRIPEVSGRILLAEDNPYNQKLIGLYARKTGAEVSVVENGEQAVEQALAGQFDLILMDLQMPVMGGIEAVTLLRQTLYDGPIVALTAHSMIGDREKVLAAGCDAFLTKPVDWQLLFEAIETHLPAAVSQGGAGNAPGDDEHELQLLSLRFAAELPRMVGDITAAAAAADWERVRSLAHQMKGVAGGLGYPDLTELGARIEVAAAGGADRAGIAELLARLKGRGEEVAARDIAAGESGRCDG